MYKNRVREILTRDERKIFSKLSSPRRIQDFLDELPINFELSGETYMSPRRVLEARTAHCFEGALFAAGALAYHGGRPLILDLKTVEADTDHVVALFKTSGRWGAISKTNHPVLRYRDPVYESVRELAMSYFNEYFVDSGRKTMISYSAPYDLSKCELGKWLTSQNDLFWLVEALDKSRHFPVASKKNLGQLRRADKIEIETTKTTEWTERGKNNFA